MNQWSFWKEPKAFIWNTINSTGLSQFERVDQFLYVTRSYFLGWLSSMASSRARTWTSTCHSWFSSHRLCGVNWFSRQSAVTLAFSNWRNLRTKGPWIVVGAFGLSLSIRDFARGQNAWDVTSQLLIFVSHFSNASLWVLLWIVFVTQLTTVTSNVPHTCPEPVFMAGP